MSHTGLARLTRWFGLDRNPLRRRSDRVEAVVRLIAVVVFIVTAVLSGGAAARNHEAGLRAAAEEAKSRRQVIVVLTESPRAVAVPDQAVVVGGHARAQWRHGDGTTKEAVVRVPSTLRVGDRATIWLDDTGRQVEAPGTHQVTLLSLVAVSLGMTVAAAVVLILVVVGVRQFNERRWRRILDEEWAAVEPQWRRLP
jgi:hypothetical protein